MLIFELSQPGRTAAAQLPADVPLPDDLPQQFRRESDPGLPQVSELGVVRHYTRLSQKNFSIDTQFYPLGSCTMKYNPRACNALAMLDGFLARHPYAPERLSQGFMACMHDLQEILAGVTGMKGGVSLAPMAGAQGELAGVAMIMAYHRDRGDDERNEIIVPDAAHGTNPATATMCGCKVREIPTQDDGDIDVDALKKVLGPQTAGIMLTNPSTIGVFERRIKEIAALVHEAGGLLYYDGANLNAILGKVRPGDMGFDAIHMNLHKTFSTPHGGGGPGAGAVGVSERLRPYLPIPMIEKVSRAEDDGMGACGSLPPSGLRPPSPASGGREKHGQSESLPSRAKEDAHSKPEAKPLPPQTGEDAHNKPAAKSLPPLAGEDAHGKPAAKPLPPRAGEDAQRAEGGTPRNHTPPPPQTPWYQWVRKKDRPQSIGRLTSFAGNAGVLLRAYVYARMLGREGMVRVAEHATLNANYLAKCMQNAGFTLAYPQRRASHEFIVTVAPQKKASGITAMDFSKGLIDRDIHAPTNYFPLLVPEAMLIEPTETETKQTLDHFVAVMRELLTLSRDDPQALKDAPRNLPVRRLDEVKAARELDVIWQPPQQAA